MWGGARARGGGGGPPRGSSTQSGYSPALSKLYRAHLYDKIKIGFGENNSVHRNEDFCKKIANALMSDAFPASTPPNPAGQRGTGHLLGHTGVVEGSLPLPEGAGLLVVQPLLRSSFQGLLITYLYIVILCAYVMYLNCMNDW